MIMKAVCNRPPFKAGKNNSPARFEPQTVKSAGQRYIYLATVAPFPNLVLDV